MLQSVLDLVYGSCRCSPTPGCGGRGFFHPLLFGSGGFGAVLVGKFEHGGGFVSVDGVGELVDRRWDLQTLVKNGTLALDAHVLRPLDEAGEILDGADVASDSGSVGGGGEKWVCLLGGFHHCFELCGSFLRHGVRYRGRGRG